MMGAAGVFTRGFLWRTLTRWTLPLPYPALGPVETDAPLAVLIDKGVNSAAEGLAGVLQNTGRARVFGQTSAGNVEAVLPFCLRDGSQAWIATGVLAPLRGPTWEGRGVVPDEPSSRAPEGRAQLSARPLTAKVLLTPERVGAGVWRFALPSETLPPYEHTNSYLVRAGDKAALIDAGSGDEAVLDALAESLDGLGITRLEALLLTHTHPDHVAGAAALSRRYSAPVYVHALEQPRLAFLPSGSGAATP